MTENKSNRKTSAPSGFEAPSVIAVIPGSFYLPSPLPFFAAQLGTNPIVKGDGWEHRDALSSSTELCVFWITQSYSYRTEQMTCHLSFSSPRHHSVQASPPHCNSLVNWPQSYWSIQVHTFFLCQALGCFDNLKSNWKEWHEIWETVFISPQSKYPKGSVRTRNPNYT